MASVALQKGFNASQSLVTRLSRGRVSGRAAPPLDGRLSGNGRFMISLVSFVAKGGSHE